jgi:(2Fe-2S) ferredoxin
MRFLFVIITGSFLLLSDFSFSQIFIHPNFGLKSHETLVIEKVELTSIAATFFLSIENRIPNGSFCADKNIFIVYPDGTRSKLVSSENIPVCPDTHKFKDPGEKLDFTLTFPPLKPGTEWIDLIEDCSDNCFSFYGVTLDNDLNGKIDDAFLLSGNDEPVKAMLSFIDITEAVDKKNLGIEGFLYMNIIRLEKQNGNEVKAAQWYTRMKSSGAPRLQQYIKYLNDQGIKY